MRLVLLSDTHGLHRELTAAAPLPEGDVLIHSGDFMRSGKWEQEVGSFAAWMRSQPHKTKILVAGNHDLLMQTKRGKEAEQYLLSEGIIYLQDSEVIISDPASPAGRVHFWGSPWTTRFMNWAFMSERGAEMRAHWDLIPPDIQVLITHGPPQGILDSSPHYGANLGCEELRSAVLRIQPKLLVFGHIHAGHGQQQLEETLCVNAAMVDEGYHLAHLPQVVDI